MNVYHKLSKSIFTVKVIKKKWRYNLMGSDFVGARKMLHFARAGRDIQDLLRLAFMQIELVRD